MSKVKSKIPLVLMTPNEIAMSGNYQELEVAIQKRNSLWDKKVIREAEGGTGARFTAQWEKADIEVRLIARRIKEKHRSKVPHVSNKCVRITPKTPRLKR